MGRRLFVVGVTGVFFLLMMTMFSSSVCSQKVQLNEKQTNVFQHIRKEILVGPPSWMYILFSIFSLILSYILGLH